MIPGLIAMIVANAAALLGAHAVLQRVRTGKPPADLVLFLVIHLLLISVAVLIAGVTGLLRPLPLGVAGAAALALLVRRGEHRQLPRPDFRGWGAPALVLVGLLLLRLLLQVWFFAPYLGDSLSYHLPKIAEWTRAGGFTAELGMDPRSTFPAGFELIEAWWVVFLHHDVLIEMAGVEFLLLAGAATHALASGFGWPSRTARVGALALMLGPGLYFQATSCVNDGAVAGLILATAALIVSEVPLPLLLIPVLLGTGVKPTFLYSFPGLAILAGYFAGRGGEDGRRLNPVAAALALAAVAVGSWWYLRNWTVYGNPIYPMGAGGMKSPLTGTVMQRVGPSLRSLEENLTCFLDIRVYDSQRAPDALSTTGFHWGAAAFAIGSVALIPVIRSEPLFRRLAVALGVSTLCVFTLVELDQWSTRFVFALTALPALAMARLWERHRFAALLGGLALASQILGTMIPGNLPPGSLSRFCSSSWVERAALETPKDPDTVGFICDDFGGAYPLNRPDYSRRVVYLRETTPDEMIARIDREQLQVIFVAGALMKRGPVLEEATRRGRLRPFDRSSGKGYDVLPAR